MRPPRRQDDSANQDRIGKAYAAMTGAKPTAPQPGGQGMQAEQQEEDQDLAQLADLLSQASALAQKLQGLQQQEEGGEESQGQPDTGSPSAAGMP